ncbi:MAG: ABC transporter permease subunit [Bacteroidota bacterium]
MSRTRLWTIAQHEFRRHLLSPVLWVLLVLIAVLTASLNPTTMIPSDATAVGGVRAFANSPYALGQFFALTGLFCYPFFAAILAGFSVIRDDEARVTEVLHSTPLTPAEYVLGKFLGVVLVLLVAMALHLGASMFIIEALPGSGLARGPFALGHYIGPFLLFALPGILLCAALAFAAGEYTRKAMAVYAVPIVYFMGVIGFMWMWNPPGLPDAINQVLMLLDPSSLRWQRQTFFMVDRGVAFYNTAPLELSGTLVLNRALVLGLTAGAVAYAVRHYRETLGGERAKSTKGAKPATSGVSAATLLHGQPLRSLGMVSAAPGWFSSMWTIARAEMRELRGQPVLYLLLLFCGYTVLEFGTVGGSVLGAAVVLTGGRVAVQAIIVLTILLSLVLVFYTVETLHRERTTRTEAILFALPFRTSAFLVGKAVANAAVVTLMLVLCMALAIVRLLTQPVGSADLGALVFVWSVVLFPTFLVWSAFMTMVAASTRSRYVAYVLGLLALVWTGYLFQSGSMTWVTNWPLWGALMWSDMGAFALNGTPLLLNRLLMLALAVLFFAIAHRAFVRTERDATATVHRLAPRQIARTLVRVAPFALAPLLLGGYLGYEIDRGFQGEAAQAEAKAYWRHNVATWKDAPIPTIAALDLNLDLYPNERRFEADGSYTLVNRTADTLAQLPMTVGLSFGEVAWTLEGNTVEAEDRHGLHLLTLPAPLNPGDSLAVGFAYAASYPNGFTRNGGGSDHFILPSGVLLSTFRGEFLPMVGFDARRGLDRDNRPEPAAYPDDFWQATLPPAGDLIPYDARVTVSAPSDFTVTSVGTSTGTRTDGDRTTVTWQTDHPVTVVNVMAGYWAMAERGTNAVYYHPEHDFNVDDLLLAMEEARAHYSQWFAPYPWQTLRINEYPNINPGATAFPTNISFSEGAGFLTRPNQRSAAAFTVAAHEVAHQWWGHLLRPAEGPGTDVLIEGAAHYATLRLREEVFGLRSRIDFARTLEQGYASSRLVDGEPSLMQVVEDGRRSTTAVFYNRGPWALWMLQGHLGTAAMDDGLRAFFARYSAPADGDHATLHDLLATLRPFAPDPTAYQTFIDQWFYDTVVPEYQISDAQIMPAGDGWQVTATIENVGTGTTWIEVAAAQGERFDGAGIHADYRDVRTRLCLAPNQPQTLTWTAEFEPDRLVLDPDALVLQLNRDRAAVRF